MIDEIKTTFAEPTPPLPSVQPLAFDAQQIMGRLKEPQTISKINYILAQHGITTSKPWLRLDVEGTTEQSPLELEIEDLKAFFAAFGLVENIVIPPNQKTTAMILFKDIVSAFLAQQTLDNYFVPKYNSRLCVKWALSDSISTTTDPGLAMNST